VPKLSVPDDVMQQHECDVCNNDDSEPVYPLSRKHRGSRGAADAGNRPSGTGASRVGGRLVVALVYKQEHMRDAHGVGPVHQQVCLREIGPGCAASVRWTSEIDYTINVTGWTLFDHIPPS